MTGVSLRYYPLYALDASPPKHKLQHPDRSQANLITFLLNVLVLSLDQCKGPRMTDTPANLTPNPLKRPRSDAEEDHATNDEPRRPSEIAPFTESGGLSLDCQPASPASSSLTSPPASPAAPVPSVIIALPNARPAKRQKLSSQENAVRKEQKRKDREAKDQLRAQKAEETRKKAEEREAKKREKEVEKQQKEQAVQEKKRQKELEQKKIERVRRADRSWFPVEPAIRALSYMAVIKV